MPTEPYYSYKRFLTDIYGHPIYRVPIDFGFGCPNRTSDTSGCTFCPQHGNRSIHTLQADEIEEQIDVAIDFAERRYGAEHLMAYIQAFTGTNAPVDKQRLLYRRVLEKFPFEAMSVGTRPDCLSDDTLALLSDLRRETDLWIELGVQTTNDATLKRINRGHTWADSQKALEKLSALGIKTAVHVILGLPGETEEDFIDTACDIAQEDFAAIKIHNLHIIKGSSLADSYTKEPFDLMDEHEYAKALIDFLRIIPAHIGIMRINTDTPPDELIAPKWSMSKGQFKDFVVKTMNDNKWTQGDGG